jgi:GNAT superfamily N-acetyltransferase
MAISVDKKKLINIVNEYNKLGNEAYHDASFLKLVNSYKKDIASSPRELLSDFGRDKDKLFNAVSSKLNSIRSHRKSYQQVFDLLFGDDIPYDYNFKLLPYLYKNEFTYDDAYSLYKSICEIEFNNLHSVVSNIIDDIDNRRREAEVNQDLIDFKESVHLNWDTFNEELKSQFIDMGIVDMNGNLLESITANELSNLMSGEDIGRNTGIDKTNAMKVLEKYSTDGTYRLVTLPMDVISFDYSGRYFTDPDLSKKAIKQAQKDINDGNVRPIIVSDSGEVIDGNHRAIANHLEGKREIEAYVPSHAQIDKFDNLRTRLARNGQDYSDMFGSPFSLNESVILESKDLHETENIVNYLNSIGVDYDDLNWLGSGDFGSAYSMGNGKVLKVTTSDTEFAIAKDIQNGNYSSFAKVYDTQLIDGNKLIILEELEIDSDVEDLWYEMESILDSQGLPPSYVGNIDLDEWKDQGNDVSGELEQFINDMYGIAYDYRRLGISAPDMRPENIGVASDGTYKAFDIEDKSGQFTSMTESSEGKNSNYNNINDAFKKWFDGSKVVNNDGSPKVVYHGTSKAFNEFSKDKTVEPFFYFTDNKSSIENGEVGAQGSGEIMEVYLSLKNLAGWEEYDNLMTDELISRGYDGIALPDSDGTTYIVFNPNDIKSVNNNGEWSLLSNNINESDGESTKSTDSDNDDNEDDYIELSEIHEPTEEELMHGTDSEFDTFKKGVKGTRAYGIKDYESNAHGHYFTRSEEMANSFGKNIIRRNIKLKKPLNIISIVGNSSAINELKSKYGEERAIKLINKLYDDAEYILDPVVETRGDEKFIEVGITNFYLDKDADGDYDYTSIIGDKDVGIPWDIFDNLEVGKRMEERGYDGAYVDEGENAVDEESQISVFVINPDNYLQESLTESFNDDAGYDLLKPMGQSINIGDESGDFINDGFSVFKNPYGSMRFVYSVDGDIKSAIQVMSTDGGKTGVIANVYTHPEYRRQGIATKLMEFTRSKVKNLVHSDSLTYDGSQWKNSLNESVDTVIAYHATDSNFNEFDDKYSEIGFHFAETPELAKNAVIKTGKEPKIVKKASLSINPILLTGQPNGFHGFRVIDDLFDRGVADEYEYDALMGKYEDLEDELSQYELKITISRLIRNFIKSKGYDSIKYYNEFDAGLNIEGTGEDVNAGYSYIIFDNDQVNWLNESVDNNFKNWFGNSQMVDDEGTWSSESNSITESIYVVTNKSIVESIADGSVYTHATTALDNKSDNDNIFKYVDGEFKKVYSSLTM